MKGLTEKAYGVTLAHMPSLGPSIRLHAGLAVRDVRVSVRLDVVGYQLRLRVSLLHVACSDEIRILFLFLYLLTICFFTSFPMGISFSVRFLPENDALVNHT